MIRLASPEDIPALQKLDPWPKERIWRQKIAAGEVVVLEIDDNVVGLARYAVLWTTVPFLGLIEIEEEHRKQGHSRAILTFLIEHLKAQGYVALLSSSQTNEPEPQAWHTYMGFQSNGVIENIADEGVGELVYRMVLE